MSHLAQSAVHSTTRLSMATNNIIKLKTGSICGCKSCDRARRASTAPARMGRALMTAR
jgi:hypothetical protein